MARKTERVTIGEDTYVITQLGGTVGSDLWDDILAAAGPKLVPQLDKLGQLLGALQGVDLEKGDAQVKQRLLLTFAPVILDVVTTMPKALKQRWRTLFAEQTLVCLNSVELNMAEAKLFDDHFAGRYVAMTAWEAAHLKLNFLSFLPSKPSSESSSSAG